MQSIREEYSGQKYLKMILVMNSFAEHRPKYPVYPSPD